MVRVLLCLECKEGVACRIRGVKDTGSHLPKPLRALSRAWSVIDRGSAKAGELSFALAGKLTGPIVLALDLCFSPRRPWPRLRHVSLLDTPRLVLAREMLQVPG